MQIVTQVLHTKRLHVALNHTVSCHQLLVHESEVYSNEDGGYGITLQELICALAETPVVGSTRSCFSCP
jgi:hypothetical protein